MTRLSFCLALACAVWCSLPVAAQQQPRRNRNVGFNVLVSHPAVQKELKLSDEQKEAQFPVSHVSVLNRPSQSDANSYTNYPANVGILARANFKFR